MNISASVAFNRCGFHLGLVIVFTLYLGACASNPAPVSTRVQPPSQKVNHHIVAPGDTLFSIAWRYEKDMNALARSNGLTPPYLLMPGQRLTLDTSAVAPSSRPASTANTAVRPTAQPVHQRHNTEKQPLRKQGTPVERPANERPANERPANERPANKPATVANTTVVNNPARGNLHWQWPVKGAVSRQYDAGKTFKGINIQSRPGGEVLAAADGVVAYAGSGLRGYGKLIIVKHSDVYLSAYAHNETIAVKEGERVSGGRKIGTVGGDPDNRGRLYFELRENGKPIDPTRLLPRL